MDNSIERENVPGMDVKGSIMKTKIEVVTSKTVLVNGQAGVNALFRVVEELKLALDHVKEITVMKVSMKTGNVIFNPV